MTPSNKVTSPLRSLLPSPVGDLNSEVPPYNTFTEIITELYQSNRPIIYEKVKRKRPDKPWMGLKNACRKKNQLYKEFLKSRTIVSEEKYTKYYLKKLTAILRRCEKQYFTELLEINKGNMKETWKILNGLIN